MNNYKQNGDTLRVTAPRDVESGAGVLVGSIFGVAVHKASNGSPVSVKRCGVFGLAKTTGEAWTEGVKLYWDDTAHEITTTDTGNLLVGAAVEDVADAADNGCVVLDGVIR